MTPAAQQLSMPLFITIALKAFEYVWVHGILGGLEIWTDGGMAEAWPNYGLHF